MIRKIISSFTASKKKYDKELKKQIELICGFNIRNFSIYEQAFVHASAANVKNGPKINNERLEYLGDSVLDLVIADLLYKEYPNKNEGDLTKIRSLIVQRSQLNRIAEELGLPKFIKGSFNKDIMPTDVKGNALEALIGAIYLDKGYDITSKFILKQLIQKRIKLKEIQEDNIDYKSELFIWAQKNKKTLKFETTSDTGKGDKKRYVINLLVDGKALGTGEGNNKKTAQQIACKNTSKKLNLKFS